MQTRFRVQNVSYLNERFRGGFIEIDDAKNEVTFVGIQRWFFLKKEKNLKSVIYSAETIPNFTGARLSVEDISAEIASELDRKTMINLLSAPRNELIARLLREDIARLEEELSNFMMLRAETLNYIVELEREPRRTLYRKSPEILSSSESPIETSIQQKESNLLETLNSFKKTIFSLAEKDELDEKTKSRVFALMCGIGMMQDAILLGDEGEILRIREVAAALGLQVPADHKVPLQTFTADLLKNVSSELKGKIFETLLETAIARQNQNP